MSDAITAATTTGRAHQVDRAVAARAIETVRRHATDDHDLAELLEALGLADDQDDGRRETAWP